MCSFLFSSWDGVVIIAISTYTCIGWKMEVAIAVMVNYNTVFSTSLHPFLWKFALPLQLSMFYFVYFTPNLKTFMLLWWKRIHLIFATTLNCKEHNSVALFHVHLHFKRPKERPPCLHLENESLMVEFQYSEKEKILLCKLYHIGNSFLQLEFQPWTETKFTFWFFFLK